jgi:hypothetical protein
MEHNADVFTLLFGSDVRRNGTYVELSSTKLGHGIPEIFQSDLNGQIVINTFNNDIPLPVIQWMISEAMGWFPESGSI